ncbi:MAG TPA: molybdate ABC transporter substrate-binding protein [Actinomycetota bacterium]|nr:molybdate ABC transporter substrate-binding protein [Actinomycetota bacterium]
MSGRTVAAILASSLLAAPACSSAAAGTRQITVGAAASLTNVFQEIGAAFERAHPGDRLRFTFSSSDGLATQIQEGAPIDVFASAAPKWLDAVSKEPGVLARATFARNGLILIAPRANPARIVRFADLARAGVRLVLAAPGVPAGDYARQALAKSGLDAALKNVVSDEQDVEGVVGKVMSGDADAGIVYATDVTPAVSRSVLTFDLPANDNVVAEYQIGVVSGTSSPALARAFMAYVLGPGEQLLERAGFGAPA